MSSIFSDPPFRRGTTLLGGEAIELDAAGNPIAGVEIVGQVKAFQDVHPSTGQRFSNRLVYCAAARYKGSLVSDASTLAGTVVAFDAAAPLTEFTAAATGANITAGRPYGVVDEYLTGELRPNDIIWVVMKGPATANKATGSAVAAGAQVEVSATAGAVTTQSTGVAVAGHIAGAQAASGDTKVRVNVWSDRV